MDVIISFFVSVVLFGTVISAGPPDFPANPLQQDQPSDTHEMANARIPWLEGSRIEQGWIALFDGTTLYGWRAESDANWKVVDGEIHVDRGPVGLLRTTSQFDNFELSLEFKAARTTNSGVFIRTSPQPQNPGPGGDCYEINIAAPDVSPFSTGAIVARAKTELSVSADQWHRMNIVANGPRIEVSIDGQTSVRYVDDSYLGRGYIGLQNNSGMVRFRNIALRPLNLPDLFNGRDLDGWNQDNRLDSRVEVTADGEMRIRSGRGQIETRESFGDFIFSTQRADAGRRIEFGGLFPLYSPGGDEWLRKPDSEPVSGQRSNAAGGLRHRRYLSPQKRPRCRGR